MKDDKQLSVVMGCQIFTRGLQRHLPAISGGGCAAQGLWTEHQSAEELLVFQPVYVFFYKKKSNQSFFSSLSLFLSTVRQFKQLLSIRQKRTKCLGLIFSRFQTSRRLVTKKTSQEKFTIEKWPKKLEDGLLRSRKPLKNADS